MILKPKLGRTAAIDFYRLNERESQFELFTMVKFQQRYQMRNRILSKTVPALEFCPFRTSQKCVPLVLQFWGFDSDGILQLFV